MEIFPLRTVRRVSPAKKKACIDSEQWYSAAVMCWHVFNLVTGGIYAVSYQTTDLYN